MVSMSLLISLVPLLPLLGFLIVSLNVKKLPHWGASIAACGSVLIAFLVSIVVFINLLGQGEEERFFSVTVFDWISAGDFSSSIGFYIDPLSALMLLIITGVGFLIHVYSVGYM